MTAAATNGTTAAPETATPKRGFGYLPCPKCGEEQVTVSLFLDEVSTFRCCECEGEWSADEVRDLIARWGRVLAWLDLAPTVE
jgi:uncharacterized protein (DUF983 family)